MNSNAMWAKSLAGGVEYSETSSYEKVFWWPTSGLSDLGEYKTFRFNMNQTSLNLHYRHATLILEGQIKVKADNSVIKTTDLNAPVHNMCAHMFQQCKFSLGGVLIESVSYVGHVSTVMEAILAEKCVGESVGLQYLYKPDEGDGAAANANVGWKTRQGWLFRPTTKGKFTARLPLNTIFGAFENFTLLSSYVGEIEFVRSANNVLFHRAAAASKEWNVTFDNVKLEIPVAKPTQIESLRILEDIAKKEHYLYSFRRRSAILAPVPKEIQDFQLTVCNESQQERPKFLFVVFQTQHGTDQTDNYSIYKHANVESIFTKLNNVQIPENIVQADMLENNYGRFFSDLIELRSNYPFPTSAIDCCNFRELFPIYSFDLSKHEQQIASSSVVCEILVRFKEPTPEHLRCYAIWVSDRTLQCFVDGSPIKIIRTPEAVIG